MSAVLRIFATLAILAPVVIGNAAAADDTCPTAPDPVLNLGHGSRYVESDAPGTEIDKQANLAADEELKPVDDFLRNLAQLASENDTGFGANCILQQIAVWANAGALEGLKTQTARLTIGSRIASFALITLQAMEHADHSDDLAEIGAWLSRLMTRQMVFWEEEASDGAKRGNLRAWAALGAVASAAIVDDPVMRGWAAWSVNYVLCSANPDGSLPQEMRRGKYALHYQLHAISPLVVSSVLLDKQGISLQSTCDGALGRIIGFALDDLGTGNKTAEITGKTQSYFDGTDVLKPFSLAWIEAYLTLDQVPKRERLNEIADLYRPMGYSKLGGDQTRMWSKDP